MNRKILMIIGVILLCLTGSASFWGIIKPAPLSHKTTEQLVAKRNLKIAVVNEDNGTVYNGELVNMASTLLRAFSNQSEYVIEEVSRSTAEKGLENGIYQLLIILPSKFSEDSLALESYTPNKAVFQYQIKSDKPLVVKQAEEAILNVKRIFNKNLVTIYFLSIIGNLQTAQAQMYDVVLNEREALNTYQSNLSQPLISYSRHFNGLSTTPNSLLNQYALLDKALNQSNDAFTSIINIEKTYDTEIDKIQALQDIWKQAVDEKGKSLAQYDELVSQLSVQQQLDELKTLTTHFNEKFNAPAIWKESTEKGDKFNKNLTALAARLKMLNGQMDTTLENYSSKITNAIEESLNNVTEMFEGTQQLQMTLGYYIKNIKESMLAKLDGVLHQGVFYNDDMLEQLGLSTKDTQYLKNINAFINWYTIENKKEAVATREETYMSQHIKQLNQSAMTNLAQFRTLMIDNIDGTIKEIKITVPPEYTLEVEGYNYSKIDDTTYRLEVKNVNTDNVKINYKLAPIRADLLSLMDVIQVRVDVKTEEQFEVTTGEMLTETNATSSIIKDNIKPKAVTKVYTQTKNLSHLSSDKTYAEAQAFYQDIKYYLEVAALVNAFYDIDLHQEFKEAPTLSLFKQTDVNHLKSIITALIKETTLTTLKNDLKIAEEQLKQFEDLALSGIDLDNKLNDLRQNIANSSTQLQAILTETEKIQQILQEKPVFTEYKIEENTDLVTVAMDINKDLIQLMAASHTLMDNTKSNQKVSKTIQSTIEKLTTDVSILEQEGKNLSDRVTDLQRVMSGKYASNQDFLKGFSDVLKNTKTGNRTNEAVYDYLSNPVEATKIQSVLGITHPLDPTTRQDNRSGLLIVLMGYVISLSIVYLLQHADVIALQKRLNVLKRVHWKNVSPPLMFLTVMGGLVGLMLGSVSGYKLDMTFGKGALFSIIVMTMTLTFTYGLNLLLLKIKSLGFLIATGLLLLCLMTATQLFDTYDMNTIEFLTTLSLLNHIENSIGVYINQANNGVILLVVLLVLSTIFGVMNAFVYRIVSKA